MEKILDEARRLYFDERDFRSAHDLLRDKGAEMIPDSAAILLQSMCLRRLEFQEMLPILRKYPDKLEVKKGIAETWVERNQWQAIDICTELLETGKLTPQEELDIRWARIRAVARQMGARGGGRYETLREDFGALWSFGDAKSGRTLIPFSRRRLFAAIAAIHSPAAIVPLQILSVEPWLSGNMKNFFEKKVAELTALKEVTQDCEKPPGDVAWN